MSNIYENVPSNQIEEQKRHLYGAIVNLLYLRDANSPYIDRTIQNLINEILGLNKLFNYQAEILSIVGYLETARNNPVQFRGCVLSALALIGRLEGGDADV